MTIKIIDYSPSKMPLSKEIHDYLVSKDIDFYLDNDWVNGPNITIVFRNSHIEKEIINELRKVVLDYKIKNPIDPNLIKEKKALYKREYMRLNALELREQREIILYEDGYIFRIRKKDGVYNSKEHESLFKEMRFKLQDIHGDIIGVLKEMDNNKKIEFFVKQFKYIATLYDGNVKNGYISYLSHVGGFFARAKKDGVQINLKEKFDISYEMYKNQNINFNNEEIQILEEWKNIWFEINKIFNVYKFPEELDNNYISYNDQYDELTNYIRKIDSGFHNLLFQKKDVKKFILSDEMIHYRNIMNLFYSTLLVFEQGMLMKHFYGYIVIKEMQSEYNDLLYYL